MPSASFTSSITSCAATIFSDSARSCGRREAHAAPSSLAWRGKEREVAAFDQAPQDQLGKMSKHRRRDRRQRHHAKSVLVAIWQPVDRGEEGRFRVNHISLPPAATPQRAQKQCVQVEHAVQGDLTSVKSQPVVRASQSRGCGHPLKGVLHFTLFVSRHREPKRRQPMSLLGGFGRLSPQSKAVTPSAVMVSSPRMSSNNPSPSS